MYREGSLCSPVKDFGATAGAHQLPGVSSQPGSQLTLKLGNEDCGQSILEGPLPDVVPGFGSGADALAAVQLPDLLQQGLLPLLFWHVRPHNLHIVPKLCTQYSGYLHRHSAVSATPGN